MLVCMLEHKLAWMGRDLRNMVVAAGKQLLPPLEHRVRVGLGHGHAAHGTATPRVAARMPVWEVNVI